ncbi:hypothetical protein LTR10_024441 [Elasticomyces elasticus]|nr:hypothetical protein LTR10_024441 [Elasticomyces elasticus]
MALVATGPPLNFKLTWRYKDILENVPESEQSEAFAMAEQKHRDRLTDWHNVVVVLLAGTFYVFDPSFQWPDSERPRWCHFRNIYQAREVFRRICNRKLKAKPIIGGGGNDGNFCRDISQEFMTAAAPLLSKYAGATSNAERTLQQTKFDRFFKRYS